jgi:hypothetical protein
MKPPKQPDLKMHRKIVEKAKKMSKDRCAESLKKLYGKKRASEILRPR